MNTLTEFLLARIDEDEEMAIDAAGWDLAGMKRVSGHWRRVGISSVEDDDRRSVIHSDNNSLTSDVADHIVRHNPARALAECEAKRRLVLELDRMERDEIGWDGIEAKVMTYLALPHADHPDYREEWRP